MGKPEPFRDRIQELRRVPARELLKNPRNWRQHPESQKQALSAVLAEVGFAGAAVARETPEGLELIDGHLRRDVAHDQDIPVLVLDVDEAEANKLLATFDPISAMAQSDAMLLRSVLDDVQTADESLAGMLDDLAKDAGILETPTIDEDEVPEEPDEPVTNPGDIWTLGRHRLLCGDSTDAGAVKRLMDGDLAGVCFTSPPYLEQRDYTQETKDSGHSWLELMNGVFGVLPMAHDGQVLVNLGLVHRECEWIPYWDPWIEWMRLAGWRRFGWYVWDKLSGMPGDWNGRLAPSFEFVWHFNRVSMAPKKSIPTKDGGKIVKSRTRGKDGVLRTHASTKNQDPVQSTKIPDSVVRCGTTKGHQIDHPATMPVGLPSVFVQSWDGIVYDPFLGSGTTLIAAEQLDRTCLGVEISPAYCDVIVERWQNLTGQKAKRKHA